MSKPQRKPDPECFTAGTVPAHSHRAWPANPVTPMATTTWLYLRRTRRHRGTHRSEALAGASRGLPGRTATSQRSRSAWLSYPSMQAAPGRSTMTTTPTFPTKPAIISRTSASCVGEYVSINEHGKMHTYRVTTVRTFSMNMIVRRALGSNDAAPLSRFDLECKPDIADIMLGRIRLHLEAEAAAHRQHDGVFGQHIAGDGLESFGPAHIR